MDLCILFRRFKQFGGFRLILELAKVDALWVVIKSLITCFINQQSVKDIYSKLLKIVEPILIKRYTQLMKKKIEEYRKKCLNHQRKRIIWFCWLQGIDNAPRIVKACYRSLEQNITDREIKVIDIDNWKEYVELPNYIINKWEKGLIPAALFSDLLRLELLIKYGGTWIDSTVLCTGFKDSYIKLQDYLDADLFLFQYTKQGSIPVSISNWFITACSNNVLLIVLREMLYAYWKDYECTLDYYIFHLFFSELSKVYPEEILAMPYGQSMNSLVIMHHLGEKFNQEKWDRLTQKVSFHKLAFRVSKEVKEDKENYFNKIISLYTK